MRASFPGYIEEIPGILADNFKPRPIARAYFLSHCHTDHTVGLLDHDFLFHLSRKVPKTYIHTSKISAVIIENDGLGTRCPEIMKNIRTLELGDNVVVLPEDTENGYTEEHLKVTLIPAGHCLGSVMFLFRTATQTVLYTGDFRINTNDLPNYTQLHETNGNVVKIDTIYMDVTFYNSSLGLGTYIEFPSRKLSVSTMLSKIKEWLDKDRNNHVGLCVSARYGYEFLYNKIYEELGLKVYVDDGKWKVYRNLPEVKGVTNSHQNTRIHVCKKSNRGSHSVNVCDPNFTNKNRYLLIYVSAMIWSGYEFDGSPYKVVSDERFDFAFATHCSRNELDYFMNYLSPAKVIGFVNGELKKIEHGTPPTIDLSNSTPPKRRKVLPSPRKVLAGTASSVKVSADVLKKIFE